MLKTMQPDLSAFEKSLLPPGWEDVGLAVGVSAMTVAVDPSLMAPYAIYVRKISLALDEAAREAGEDTPAICLIAALGATLSACTDLAANLTLQNIQKAIANGTFDPTGDPPTPTAGKIRLDPDQQRAAPTEPVAGMPATAPTALSEDQRMRDVLSGLKF